jgi:hypothetical protein
MATIADIEILLLVMARTALNNSLIQDWIAIRRKNQGVQV